MENLKPCPVCGRVPIVKHKDGYGWEIVCEGHNETSWCSTEDWAIQDWNEQMEDEIY